MREIVIELAVSFRSFRSCQTCVLLVLPIPRVAMSKGKVKMSYLVRWLDDEQVGVMPSSALENDEKAYVGSFVEFHWGSPFTTQRS